MSNLSTGSATAAYPTPARSVAQLFVDRVAATPEREALRFPVGGGWESLTWEQTHQKVFDLAAGLLGLGIQTRGPGRRSSARPASSGSWPTSPSCAPAPRRPRSTRRPSPTTSATSCPTPARGSSSPRTPTQVAKLHEQRAKLPSCREGDRHRRRRVTATGCMSWAELARRAAPHTWPSDSGAGRRRSSPRIRPRPAGHAHLHVGHDRPAQGRRAARSRAGPTRARRSRRSTILRPDDLQYLWLPLSHSFGKVLLAAQLQIGFATAVDGRVDKIVENLAIVKPTFMAGAPRIFEKVHTRVVQTAKGEGGVEGEDLRLGVRGRAAR